MFLKSIKIKEFKRLPKAPVGVRKYSQYNYNSYSHFQPPPRTWPRKLFYSVAGLSAFAAFSYYMWWPKHTFPSSVASILRKGLWAESDRGEMDYQLALKHYLEALEECKEIGVDPLSDEYTGIQLKIAEMLERLNRLEDAAFIYNEIATLYLSVLTAAKGSPDAKRIRSEEHRGHLIQKDLRIALKLVELNKANAHLSKAILVTHLLIAQDEVQKKLGPNNSIEKFVNSSADKETQFKATVDSNSIEIDDNNGAVTKIIKNPEAWEPFQEEFFTVMDLLSTVCISTGDIALASKIRVSMTEWMLIADADSDKVLMSQCNLASLLYLQAEEYESQEVALKRAFFEKAGFDYDTIRSLSRKEIEENNYLQKIQEAVEPNDRVAYRQVIENKEKCVQLSIKSYESVLEFAKTISNDDVSKGTRVGETIALATYGLGVVNLHLGDYDKAERLLREARVRSKQCNYSDLIEEIERELKQLFKEKKQVVKDKLHEGSIEMNIHFKDI